MKYQKVQTLKTALRSLRITNTEAAYRMGVRENSLHAMIKKGNIVVDGAVYNRTKHIISDVYDKGILTISEFLKDNGMMQEDLALELGITRQAVALMCGNGSIIYKGKVYSVRRYRLDKK